MINLLKNLGTSFTFQTFDDKGGNRDLARIFHGTLEQHSESLKALNARGAGVYFAVNETDLKGRAAANITKIRAVFVDLDTVDANRTFDYALAPSHIVESSPGKHHCYWFLADELPLNQFTAIQKKLASMLGGDLKVCDLPRVLRVPGFHHMKGAPFLVREIGGNAQKYTVSKILEFVGGAELPEPSKVPESTTDFTEGSRNDSLFHYCRRLRIQGLDICEVETLALLKASECLPPLPEAEALKVIKSSANYKSIDQAEIARLAALAPIDYDRVRIASAKAQGVRTSTLDELVGAARIKEQEAEGEGLFPEVIPYDEPVDLADLLDEISKTIRRFIAMDEHQADLATLWATASWFVDAVHFAPIALINAPAKACGKTQLLTVLQKLAPRGAQCAGISPSVLFRMIEKHRVNLFVDEIETVLKENEELRGLLDAGHSRDSAYVWRNVLVGDDYVPTRFGVFGFKAIAGINAVALTDTVTSRSIVFEMRRKKLGEHVERLRDAEPELFKNLRAQLARCVADYSDAVRHARPRLPDALSDREQDNLEPLLQVAAAAGNFWPETATAAALRLKGDRDSDDIADELLADIREVFETKRVDKISTADLLYALTADDERSWQTYNRGKTLTSKQLSNKLKAYKILPKTIRICQATPRGYERHQFTEAFDRYLAPALPEKTLLSATKSPKPAPVLGLACCTSKNVSKTKCNKMIEYPPNLMFMRLTALHFEKRASATKAQKSETFKYKPIETPVFHLGGKMLHLESATL